MLAVGAFLGWFVEWFVQWLSQVVQFLLAFVIEHRNLRGFCCGLQAGWIQGGFLLSSLSCNEKWTEFTDIFPKANPRAGET